MSLVFAASACAAPRSTRSGAPAAPAVAAAAPRRLIPLTTSSPAARDAFERGQALLDAGKLAASKAPFEEAIAADPQFAQAHFYLAASASGADRRRLVERANELAVNLPLAERTWIEAATAGTTGDPSAPALAAKVAKLAPDDWQAHWHVGQIAQHHTGDLAVARAAYARAIELAPERAMLYRGLAWVLVGLGDLRGAAVAIDRYAARSPDDARPLDSKGEILLLGGQLDAAERAFTAALAIDPSHRSEDGLGMIALYRGDVAAAIQWYRRGLAKRSVALDGTSEDHLARFGLGMELVELHIIAEQPDMAEASITELEKMFVDVGVTASALRVQQMRGALLLARGDVAGARGITTAAFQEARASSPNSRLARALALLQLRIAIASGERPGVERAARELYADRSDDPSAKLGRALVAHYRKDRAALDAALSELQADKDHEAEAKLLAAELAIAAGDRDRATRLRREVAAMYGRSPTAYRLRRRAELALGTSR